MPLAVGVLVNPQSLRDQRVKQGSKAGARLSPRSVNGVDHTVFVVFHSRHVCHQESLWRLGIQVTPAPLPYFLAWTDLPTLRGTSVILTPRCCAYTSTLSSASDTFTEVTVQGLWMARIWLYSCVSFVDTRLIYPLDLAITSSGLSHLQGKTVRVGRTIYPGNLRTFATGANKEDP